MIVSWNWLKEYVLLDMSVEEFEQRLMMAGLNHEGTEHLADDVAVDLEVTSNRPDCLGHLGVAREAAVLWNRDLKIPPAQPHEAGPPIADLTQVTVECPKLCPRYTARVIQGVKIGPSPQWMQQRLEAVGLAAVNNVVDITNYVLLECGQPLHAFDLATLEDRRIVVREPHQGEKLQAINHKTYELEPGMCVIADGRRAIGLGGVMGGADTEVSESTTDLLIEAAEFDPVSIRNTARKLNLHSPSSYRFERGLDPQGVDWASRRCCELILDIAGGTLGQGVIDIGDPPSPREKVVLRFSQLKRILGIEVDRDEAVRILSALGCEKQSGDSEQVEVVPPSWRRDLTREIDLVEEVARIHGYDKIPEDVRVPMGRSARRQEDIVLGKLRGVMTAAGFNEAMTLSGIPSEWSGVFPAWTSSPPLEADTPIIRGASVLRTSLIPSLLAARRVNERADNPRIELFEIAKVYLPQGDGLPREEKMLSLTSGEDYYHVRGVVEALIEQLHTPQQLIAKTAQHELFTERCAQLFLGDELLGYIGEVSPQAAEPFELRGPTTVAELQCSVLLQAANLIPAYQKSPEFPAMPRDLNLVVSEDVQWAQIAAAVQQSGGPYLEGVQFQETYRNQKLAGQQKKKVLFSFAFRRPDGTLTAEQANEFQAAIQQECEKRFAAELG